jgi:hypothetical protein
VKRKNGVFNPEQCESEQQQQLDVDLSNFVMFAKNCRKNLSDVDPRTFKRTAHTRQKKLRVFTCAVLLQFTVHSKILQLSVLFSPSASQKPKNHGLKRVFSAAFSFFLYFEKNISTSRVQNTHVITTIHHT